MGYIHVDTVHERCFGIYIYIYIYIYIPFSIVRMLMSYRDRNMPTIIFYATVGSKIIRLARLTS